MVLAVSTASHCLLCRADDKIQPNIALLPIPRSQSVIQRKPENHPVSTSACSSSAYRDFRDHVSQINQGIGRRGTRSESDDDTSSNSTLSIDFRTLFWVFFWWWTLEDFANGSLGLRSRNGNFGGR